MGGCFHGPVSRHGATIMRVYTITTYLVCTARSKLFHLHDVAHPGGWARLWALSPSQGHGAQWAPRCRGPRLVQSAHLACPISPLGLSSQPPSFVQPLCEKNERDAREGRPGVGGVPRCPL